MELNRRWRRRGASAIAGASVGDGAGAGAGAGADAAIASDDQSTLFQGQDTRQWLHKWMTPWGKSYH